MIPTQTTNRTIDSTGITELNASSFKSYADTLKDVYIIGCMSLTRISRDTFRRLRHLQTVSIQGSPFLTFIPNGVFHRRSFKVLRITHSGLESLPLMAFSGGIFDIIDIVNNRIRILTTCGISVAAHSMNLEGNQIELIEARAFNGSNISKLILKRNPRLTSIHDDAFEGLENLRTLDLSDTSITKLPTKGLQGLEILRLQGIHSLKVIPSIYDFHGIKEAYMTYSYHCCAFRLPHEIRNEYRAMETDFRIRQEKYCNEEQSFSSSHSSSASAARLTESEPMSDSSYHVSFPFSSFFYSSSVVHDVSSFYTFFPVHLLSFLHVFATSFFCSHPQAGRSRDRRNGIDMHVFSIPASIVSPDFRIN